MQVEQDPLLGRSAAELYGHSSDYRQLYSARNSVPFQRTYGVLYLPPSYQRPLFSQVLGKVAYMDWLNAGPQGRTGPANVRVGGPSFASVLGAAPSPFQVHHMLGHPSPQKVQACEAFRGHIVPPLLHPACTHASIELPYITSCKQEVEALLDCWEDVGYTCPVLGCQHPPKPPGPSHRIWKEANPQLRQVTTLPEVKDFFLHWRAHHRAEGYTVFYPCEYEGCDYVSAYHANYKTHLRTQHGGRNISKEVMGVDHGTYRAQVALAEMGGWSNKTHHYPW